MATNSSNILYLADLQSTQPQLDLLPLIPRTLAQKTQTLVFGKHDNTLHVLTTNAQPTLYYQMIDKLRAMDYKVESYFTDTAGFTYAMTWFDQLESKQKTEQAAYDYRHAAGGEEAVELIKDTYKNKQNYNEGAFIDEILRLSYQSGASDVHFQTEEMGVVMRVRRDGILSSVIVFTHKEFQKYLMKIKFISGVKMNVTDISQDGRFDFDILQGEDTVKIDVRVSIMPGLRGESIVMRFLDASKGIMSLEEIGAQQTHVQTITGHLNRNFGLILMTGPTGSGKTTTVYSLLNMLNTTDKKIITLEDPVEYELPGIEQSQINENKKYTFEAGLKGILRHDPDIIMVGEIRTLETADMAINAALTGHLVISTIHTNSAVEAITRLLNMGIKPFMLAAALNLVVGQRLVRKLSDHQLVDAPSDMDAEIRELLAELGQSHPEIGLDYNGKVAEPLFDDEGMPTSYHGRTAVMETLTVGEDLKKAILDGKTSSEITALAQSQGYLTMKQDAIIKMLQGETSLDEIERVF